MKNRSATLQELQDLMTNNKKMLFILLDRKISFVYSSANKIMLEGGLTRDYTGCDEPSINLEIRENLVIYSPIDATVVTARY